MSFFKNRTVIGVICIVLSLLIFFALTPLFNQGISQKTEIVRVTQPIKIGEVITKDMVQTVEVGVYHLPENVVKHTDTIIGKYASADLVPGDYIIASKIADAPAAENAYLYNLTGEKQAISVSVKRFAAGLSSKLISGDIVSIIASDYKKQGVTVIPPELQYVEAIAVTLLVTPEQSKLLAELYPDRQESQESEDNSQPEQTEVRIQEFLDMIASSVIKFNIDHFICGNTYRCIWALREYPTWLL